MTKSSCKIVWTPPNDDGGLPITHYVVERREAGRKLWTKLAVNVKNDVHEHSVNNLIEMREYEFKA